MACCATTGCGDPDCQVCTVSTRFAIVACDKLVDGEPCKFVKGHRPACTADPRAGKVERAELKESKPVDPGNLAFRKRQRAGPNWVPPDRRV